MSRTREEKGFILINKEATTVHIFAILPRFRITALITKLVRLHGLLSFQNKHMSGNLWLLIRKCSDIILKRQRTKLKCYIFMQSCGMQQENEMPTQNIMETLCFCEPTK